MAFAPRLLRLVFAGLLVLLLLPAPMASAAPGGVLPALSEARVRPFESMTRVTFTLTDAVPFRIFVLSAPDRVVIDLPDVRWAVPRGASTAGSGLVERIRHGAYQAGTFRLVIDCRRPVTVSEARMLAAGDRYRLLLDLEPADAPADGGTVAALIEDLARDATAPPGAERPPASGMPLLAGISAVPEIGVTDPRVMSAAGLSASAAPSLATTTGFTSPRPRPASPSPAAPLPGIARWVIAIDPGHGGRDPGAISRTGVYEKQITLAAARALRDELQALKRYRVVLTRNRDVFIRLRDRIAIARAAGADLFVSLHADKMPNPSVRGLSVYTLSERASDAEAAWLAERENKADILHGVNLKGAAPEVTNILIDLAQRETMNESARIAQLLVSELRSETILLPKTHRVAGFAVLKAPDVPSVLVELGYLSNAADERLLRSPEHRRKLARAIASAIDGYFVRVEARSRP